MSFTNRSLDLLQKEEWVATFEVRAGECKLSMNHFPRSRSFWVCEKSDGVRVLVMALGTDDGPPEVYLVRSLQPCGKSSLLMVRGLHCQG